MTRAEQSGARSLGSETIHLLNNHLGIILGFVDLLLAETPEDDIRRSDLLEIKQATVAALALLAPAAHRG